MQSVQSSENYLPYRWGTPVLYLHYLHGYTDTADGVLSYNCWPSCLSTAKVVAHFLAAAEVDARPRPGQTCLEHTEQSYSIYSTVHFNLKTIEPCVCVYKDVQYDRNTAGIR